jgi:hypothetical protein
VTRTIARVLSVINALHSEADGVNPSSDRVLNGIVVILSMLNVILQRRKHGSDKGSQEFITDG